MRKFNFRKYVLVKLCLLLVSIAPFAIAKADSYQEIEWIELMPQEDLDILLNPPELFAQIEDGSAADSIDALAKKAETDDSVKRFQEALSSTRVIQSWDKKSIRLPGYIVPLESNEDQKITEFFIVPYFGACLHMPPPPPNQIVFVKYEKGVELNNLYDPFWFEGKLVIETNENDLGTAAYRMMLDKAELYEG